MSGGRGEMMECEGLIPIFSVKLEARSSVENEVGT